MNKKIFLLLAVVAALALVFVACETNEPADTTVTTDASTDAPTEAPTDDATEATTDDTTDEATEEVTTEEVTTEEVTTEEVTTEEVTTEEVTTEEVTTEPDNSYTVDLGTVTATGSYPNVDVPINAGSLGLTDGHVITLHYGSINLGEMDLSQYSKVTVTYATPCGIANGQDMNAEYEATGKRVLLLNAPSAIQEGSAFEYLPAEDAIVTTAPYEISPAYSQLMTVEIDLTDVDYNGQLYLSFDFRNANNEFGALGYLVFVAGIRFE